MRSIAIALLFISGLQLSCKKDSAPVYTPVPPSFNLNAYTVNGQTPAANTAGINLLPVIRLTFSSKIERSTVAANMSLTSGGGAAAFNTSFENNDNVVVVQPTARLLPLTRYTFTINSALKSSAGGSLSTTASFRFLTAIDSTDKFPSITDTALVELVQQQTFKYFWDFSHPVSGLARERNTSGDLVTSGGSGFGVMAILAGIKRASLQERRV